MATDSSVMHEKIVSVQKQFLFHVVFIGSTGTFKLNKPFINLLSVQHQINQLRKKESHVSSNQSNNQYKMIFMTNGKFIIG